MKRIVFICCMLFSISDTNLFSQVNLVPNPSFEIINASFTSGNCLLVLGGFDAAYNQMPPWDNPSQGSPDPYDTCAVQFSSAGVPNSMYGYQQPHSGGAYAGATFYESDEFREYIQVQLTTPLVAGRNYCASFFVNLADTVIIACNNIGLYFSNVHINSATQNSLGFIPQINETNIITDQFNWTEISGEYTAQGGENYIIIGNFYPNSQTDTTAVVGSIMGHWAYYFIDDVSVIDCTGQGVNEFQVSNPKFQIVPNPNNGEFSINLNKEFKNVKIEITDVLGKQVYSTIAKETKQINVSLNQPQGVYFVSIKADEEREVMKLVKQ